MTTCGPLRPMSSPPATGPGGWRSSRRRSGAGFVRRQTAAIAMAAGMRVDDLARVALSYPTYAGVLVRAAVVAARQLNLNVSWQAYHPEGAEPRQERAAGR